MNLDELSIQLPSEWRDTFGQIKSEENGELTERLRQIRRLIPAVDALNNLSGNLPRSYGWRFMTAEAFSKHVWERGRAGATKAEINGIYWRDTAATIEAYTVMSVWRIVDICQSAFRCLDRDGIVASAILARSALETSVQFVQDARTITATIEPVFDHDFATTLSLNKDLEEYLLKTVFASRKAGVEDIYKSRNILTALRKIAKIIKDVPIEEEYETLCEVTHPNFLGRSIYLVDVKERDDGSELRIISPTNGINSTALMQSTLWALAWAIEAQVSSTLLLQNTLKKLVAKLSAS